MKALITGGAGFLGYHLALSLVEAGAEVTLVDSFSRGRQDRDLKALIESGGARLIERDLEEPGAFDSISDSWDEIYHLAAVVGVSHVTSDPARVLRVNLRTLLNAVEFFLGGDHGRFFFASTSEVYAWTKKFHSIPTPTPEDVPLAVDRIENGRATYALSKIVGEMLMEHGLGERDKSFISARFHNVYGPRMGSVHVIPELFLRMKEGETPLAIREARATRAFCYVDDAVGAVRHLMEDAPNGVYNVGNSSDEVSISDLALRIARIAGYPQEDIRLDLEGTPAIARRCPDITRLRSTGFEPVVELDEGLRRTLQWYDRNRTPRGI